MGRGLKFLIWASVAALAVTAGLLMVGRPHEQRAEPARAFIVLAGQSNALGFGLTDRDLPPAARTPDPRVMIWNGATFVTMQPGVNTGSPRAPHAWGPEVEFARRWRAAHPDGVLHILKHARGSTSLAADPGMRDWAPESRELFAETETEITEARATLEAEGAPPQVTAILWMQGEQDATEPEKATAYGVNLVNLFAQMRRGWTAARTPILFGQVNGRSGFELGEIVRDAQHGVDVADPDADMATTDGLALQPDRIHLSAAGQIGLGAAFYELYARR